MKLGNVFDDNFDIVMSLLKDAKSGYVPVAGLFAQSGGSICVPADCDPTIENKSRTDCNRQCFYDADDCGCNCGSCEKKHCNCGDTSGNPLTSYYEDFINLPGGYNFGEVENQCYAPPSLGALVDSGSCKCSPHCPGLTGNPSPDAPAEICCSDKNSTHKCVSKTNPGVKCPPAPENGNIEGGHIWKKYKAQKYIGGSLQDVDCYRCDCPNGYESKKPTKYYCTIGANPECKEDVNGPYATFELCDEAVKSGQCAERWKCKVGAPGCEQTTDWKDKFKSQKECNDSNECVQKYYFCKWNSYGFKYECKQTTSKTFSGAEWYDTEDDCKAAIEGNQGKCATGYTCKVSEYTSECKKAPSDYVLGQNAAGAGKVVWATEEECKAACCSGSEYSSALGRCSWYGYGPAGDDFRRFCTITTRSDCASRPTWCPDGGSWGCTPDFTCCGTDGSGGYFGCKCGDWNGTSCPSDSPACGDDFQTYIVQPTIFGAGYIESCGCKKAPSAQPLKQ